MQSQSRWKRKIWFVGGGALVTITLVVVIILQSRSLAKSISVVSSGVFAVQPLWTFESPERVISTPLVGNGQIFIRTTDAVRVLDALTGVEISDIPNKSGNYLDTHPPVLYEDKLFVPNGYGVVFAYDLDSSKAMWQACSSITGCRSPSLFDPTSYNVVTIAYNRNILVVTRYDSAMTAYDIQTGHVLWEHPVEHRGLLDIHTDGNTLFTGEYASIAAYDIQSGQQIWSYPLTLVGRFVMSDKVLYIVNGSGPTTEVVAFDTIAQRVMWTAPISTTQATDYTYLVLSGNTLMVASDSLAAIDLKTGEKNWETEPLYDLEQPMISNNIVLVRGGGHYLYAFDSVTGRPIGELDLQNYAPRTSGSELNPAVAQHLLIVSMGLNDIIAFDLQKP